MKYQMFYPENDRPVSPIQYDTLAEIEERYRRWTQLAATGQNDLTAYMNEITGDIVVVRIVEND